jgi:hypothetical protein
LADNPKYQKLLYQCLKKKPPEAVTSLCAQFGIQADWLQALDASGAIRAAAENTISTIQQLYQERAAQHGGNLNGK